MDIHFLLLNNTYKLHRRNQFVATERKLPREFSPSQVQDVVGRSGDGGAGIVAALDHMHQSMQGQQRKGREPIESDYTAWLGSILRDTH